jgi:hypothetical protein
MIAGEGLAGVAIAFVVAARRYWPESGWSISLGRVHFADNAFSYVSGAPATVLGPRRARAPLLASLPRGPAAEA